MPAETVGAVGGACPKGVGTAPGVGITPSTAEKLEEADIIVTSPDSLTRRKVSVSVLIGVVSCTSL